LIHSKQFTLDQFAPIAVYHKIKNLFDGEISYLFESANNANYSFIIIGARQRLQYKNNMTIYTNEDKERSVLDKSAFEFLKQYYKTIDKTLYRQKWDIGYVDGFIGYIGYDMVKVFEPKLQSFMNNLTDELMN